MFCFSILLLNLREILASQEDLKGMHPLHIPNLLWLKEYGLNIAMLAKVQSVQKEVDKLTSGNETLQMYIDNLTVQMAKRR